MCPSYTCPWLRGVQSLAPDHRMGKWSETQAGPEGPLPGKGPARQTPPFSAPAAAVRPSTWWFSALCMGSSGDFKSTDAQFWSGLDATWATGFCFNSQVIPMLGATALALLPQSPLKLLQLQRARKSPRNHPLIQ